MCGRAELPLIPIDAPYAAISLRDPGSKVPELPEPQLCRSVLRLEFDDAEPTTDPVRSTPALQWIATGSDEKMARSLSCCRVVRITCPHETAIVKLGPVP